MEALVAISVEWIVVFSVEVIVAISAVSSVKQLVAFSLFLFP